MAHTKATIPSGFVAPSNPICIQCRVNPTEIYDKPTTSDYLAPQYTLAFTVATNPSTQGIQKSKYNVKRKRDGDVQNIITNFHNIQKRLPIKSLRCLGVTFGSVLDAKGAMTHPDSMGRLAVIVSGAVTIVCNQTDLVNLHVGDLLTWTLSDNGQCYEGYPNDWSTARIVRATPPSLTDIDTSFESVFGPKIKWENTPENIAALQSQLGVLQAIAPASILDVTHLAGITPYAAAEALAYIFFAQMGVELKDRDEWIDKLYNPESEYYCFECKPVEKTSIKWLQHCLGDERGEDIAAHEDKVQYNGSRMDVYQNKTISTHDEVNADDVANNMLHLPPALGWFYCNNTAKTNDADRLAELSKVAKMTALPSRDNLNEYLLYKAIHGVNFTSTDWAQFVLNQENININDVDQLGAFTDPIFNGGTTHKRMAAMVFLEGGYMNRLLLPYENRYAVRLIDLARVGFDFYGISQVDADAVERLVYANQNSTPEMRMKYAQTVLGMQNPTHHQNVFGMLLEKNQRANEARILLKV